MVDSTTPSDERILAIDHGTHRIGLATGSSRDGLAVSAGIVPVDAAAPDAAVEAVARRAEDEGARRLLVGLPLNMDGSEGPAARRVRHFAEALAARLKLPMEFLDERLTSEAARERLRAAETDSGRRRTGRLRSGRRGIDDLAAVILLQGWFDEAAARRARTAWGSASS